MGTQQDAVPRRSASGGRWLVASRGVRGPPAPPPSPGSPRRVFLRVSCVVYRGSRTTGSEWDGFSEESVFMAARGEGQVQPPGQEAGGTRRASSSATEPVRACGEL